MRFWKRHPTQAAWLTGVLGVAIAVAATVWSIAHGLWLAPPPFSEPDRLAAFGWTAPSYTRRMSATSVDEYLDLKKATAGFATMAGVEPASFWFLKRPDRLTSVVAAYATTDLFAVLGVNAALGRTFEPFDADAVGGIARAVLTDRVWREAFQADPGIVGRVVQVSAEHETRSVEVVGVLPPGTWIPGHATGDVGIIELFLASPDGRRPGGAASRRIYDRQAILRLAPGLTPAHANERLTPILQHIDVEHPLFKRVRQADVLSLQEMWFGASRPLLWLLSAAAAFVMLVTLANAVGLMTVIASRRSREFAVRAALGASPARLRVQTVIEMAAIAAVSWLASGALATGLTRLFVWMAPRDIPRVTGLYVDWRGWLLAAALASVSCLLLGVIPGWVRRQRHVLSGLNGGLAFTPPRRTQILRRVMIGVQVAVVLALLATAGLLSTTLYRLLNQPLGFDPSDVVIAKVTPTEKYFLDPPRYQQAMDDVRRLTSAAPGTRDVALAFDPPLAAFPSRMQVRFLERTPDFVSVKFVSDGFFSVMRIPILAGRELQPGDYADGTAAVVNELFAITYFGNVESAVGREFDFGRRHRIVGVSGNVREEGITVPMKPVLYPLLSASLRTPGYFHVVSRERRGAGRGLNTIEDAVRRADPTLHVEVSRLSERLRAQTANARTQSAVLALLAGVTLLLAMLGIYATISQVVEDRQREMAIRSALGASPRHMVTVVMLGVTASIVAGIAAGGLLSWSVARVTRQFLFDMSPFDAPVWVGAALLLTAAATLAAWLPARRAGIVDPISALKGN